MIQSIDLDQLEMNLETLIESYRGALKHVERLPSFGRINIEYDDQSIDQNRQRGLIRHVYEKLSDPYHRWVAKSLVRLFVRSHIKSKLKEINRCLRVESLRLIKDTESAKRAKKLKSYISQLDKFDEELSLGLNLPGMFIVRAQWFPPFIAFITPILTKLIGIDFSSIKAFEQSTIQVVSPSISSHTIVLLLVLFIEIYVFFLSPSINNLGFRVKRAIFSGGKTESWDLFEEYSKPMLIKWLSFPDTNVYRSENQVFDVLGFPKSKEFPLDFVTSFKFYLAIIFTSYFLVAFVIISLAIKDGTLKTIFNWWDFLGVFALGVVGISYLINSWRNLHRRREEGNV